MSLEVACPNCQAKLKAPDGMAGKKARCKKCQHSFHLPGGNAHNVDSVGDSEHLSVVMDAPFSFDAPPVPAPAPAPAPAKSTVKKPVAAAPAVANDNPFDIPTNATAVEPETTTEPKSTSKYKTKATKAAKASSYRGGAKAADGGKGRTMLFLVAALLCAGGGAAGFYAFNEYQKSNEPKPTPAVAANPSPPTTDPQPVVPPPVEKSADKAKKATDNPKPMPNAGAAAPAAGTPKRAGNKVTGGMKLPAPAAKPALYEKATATIALEHEAKAVKQLILGGAEGPVIIVVRRTSDGLGGLGRKDTLDRYALNTFRKIDETIVPADAVKNYPRVGDVSPGGDRFAYEHPAGKLSVSQLGTDTKLLDGLDLAADPTDKHPGIAAIYFLADDKVAVVTPNGSIEAWDITAKKKMSTSEAIPGAANLVDKRSLAFHRDADPAKCLLFAYAGGSIYSVGPGGRPQVALSLPKSPSEGLALAVDSSANRLAVAFRATDPGEHVRFVHARVGDPSPASDQPLDSEIGTPILAEWTRPETYTMLTDKGIGFAYDAESNGLIAAIRPPVATLIVADGTKHWCLLPNATDPKKAMLVNVTVPPEGYSPSLTGAKWSPFSLAITAEGTVK